MLCVRCKKRPAIVFVQKLEAGEAKSEGYCLSCARELGIKPVDDIMKQFGISDQDLEAMEERFAGMMENGDMDPAAMMQQLGMMAPPDDADGDEAPDDDTDEGGDGDFTPGGNATFPFGIFGGRRKAEEAPEKEAKSKNDRGKKRKFLDNYCENLTRKARDGKLDRIVGRDREIYRTVQILSRRQKNNPCLIGEAGVGKTAIAEGIALHIAEGNVPARLRDKEIYLLDLTSLVAGTQFRGQFESRVKGLIGEVKAAGNVILFIDEIHNITGAGDSEGAMNAANILKPALSRGEIQVIGATTFAEYRKYIEKDQALERRFQPVKIEEPSIDDATAVIAGIRQYYEAYHHVKVSEAIVRSTVTLSERYITDRFLPDKAIDLLDEACACCSLRHPEITEWVENEKHLAGLKEQEAEQEQAKEGPDYEKLAQIKSEIIRLEAELPAQREAVDGIQVTMEDVAKVIELWTGIPAAKVKETEYTKLAHLEENLNRVIIGQPEALHLVANAVKRSRADISARRRPASFIFVGPTGVGKTELVKQLALQLFDTVDPLIRLDMSEFMEKHTVSRLIGSPPGYVGYDEAGQLTEKVRRKPYSVVLFDEIEKAHPDVMNLLLQILDEGKINDAQGRTVNFENTVICMTSNAGSSDKTGETGFNRTIAQMSRDKSIKALGEFLRPEFMSRVDEIVTFAPLSPESLKRIAALMLGEYKEPLAAKGIGLSWTEAALALLCEKAKGGKFGARDLRRVIRKEVEDAIAGKIISGEPLTAIEVDTQDGDIVLHC
ncbi:ATP-dependent Clp protease ATP-binding subunit [Ruthenibacterium lactatiformans]|uniref:ATP-dependent Clp protease ATP-binding subunit n=1 Tax=Ruthenibacterium lactatiformans TaxID=1550024 RepID=UPI001968654D|nr:ATP-dependent Clp protease ATP-binding subunit [Ruthenibacterium lactatiformans]MBN3012341.1 AAA family ATPase [Ruthenibacterium lactatiformans]